MNFGIPGFAQKPWKIHGFETGWAFPEKCRQYMEMKNGKDMMEKRDGSPVIP